MEIKIKLDYINYGELVTKILPMLGEISGDSGMTAQILKGISHVPTGLAKTIVDALPQETKDNIAIMLINKRTKS